MACEPCRSPSANAATAHCHRLQNDGPDVSQDCDGWRLHVESPTTGRTNMTSNTRVPKTEITGIYGGGRTWAGARRCSIPGGGRSPDAAPAQCTKPPSGRAPPPSAAAAREGLVLDRDANTPNPDGPPEPTGGGCLTAMPSPVASADSGTASARRLLGMAGCGGGSGVF